MIRIGDYNTLEVVSVGKSGAVLSDGSRDVIMPPSQCDETVLTGATLKVFVYRNSKDRVVATTRTPIGKVGDFAALRVVSVTGAGAFLDWGLDKDLLVPHNQMLSKMQEGFTYVVRIITDSISKRIIGTPRLRPFFTRATEDDLPEGTKVSALIYECRDTGTFAVINNMYQAMFPRNEFPNRPRIGTRVEAYVKSYDSEGRMNVSRAPAGKQAWSDAEAHLLKLINDNDGFLPLHDKSSPAEISDITGLSKKSFKKVVGTLYKKQVIQFTDSGIELAK